MNPKEPIRRASFVISFSSFLANRERERVVLRRHRNSEKDPPHHADQILLYGMSVLIYIYQIS